MSIDIKMMSICKFSTQVLLSYISSSKTYNISLSVAMKFPPKNGILNVIFDVQFAHYSIYN